MIFLIMMHMNTHFFIQIFNSKYRLEEFKRRKMFDRILPNAGKTFNISPKSFSKVKYPPIDQVCIFSKVRKLREHQKIQQIDNPNLSVLIKKEAASKTVVPIFFINAIRGLVNRDFDKQAQEYSLMYDGIQKWKSKQQTRKLNSLETGKIKAQQKKKRILQVRQSSLRNVKKAFDLKPKLQIKKTSFRRKCQQLIQARLMATKYDISPRISYKQDLKNCDDKARMTSYVKRMEHFSFLVQKDNLKFSRNQIFKRQQERFNIFNSVQVRQRQQEKAHQKLQNPRQASEYRQDQQNSSVPKDLIGRITFIRRNPSRYSFLAKIKSQSQS